MLTSNYWTYSRTKGRTSVFINVLEELLNTFEKAFISDGAVLKVDLFVKVKFHLSRSSHTLLNGNKIKRVWMM